MSDPSEDEFSEIVDAVIPRVDLVSKSANGRPFLIAKSAASGFVPAEEVHALLEKSTQKETTMASRKNVAAAVATARTAAQELLRSAGVPLGGGGEIRKAQSAPAVPVYDSQGRLLGFADPDDVSPAVVEAPAPSGSWQRIRELLPDGHPDKLIAPASVQAPPTEVVGPDGKPVTSDAIQKADARFRSLLRRGTPTQDRQLRDGVARIATKIAYDQNVPIRDALLIAKSAVVAAAGSGTSGAAKPKAVADAHRMAKDNVVAYAAIRDRYRPITG